MAMNPKLLRPRATGFDPRSISGCICNIDASVLSSLYQNSDGTTAASATNDPVGYMTDLSGSGSHAKQTVATGSRPFLKLNNQNGRPGLLFDGSNDFLTANISGFQSLTAVTIVQVIKPTAAAAADTNSALFFGWGNGGNASGSFPANRAFNLFSATGVISGETIGIALETGLSGIFGRLGSSTYVRQVSTAQLLAVTASSAGTSIRANNSSVTLNLTAEVTTSTNSSPAGIGYTVDNDLHICCVRGNGVLTASPECTLHQMIVYSRALSSTELTTLWNALRPKWGL
jgi:hypothetical protein